MAPTLAAASNLVVVVVVVVVAAAAAAAAAAAYATDAVLAVVAGAVVGGGVDAENIVLIKSVNTRISQPAASEKKITVGCPFPAGRHRTGRQRSTGSSCS